MIRTLPRVVPAAPGRPVRPEALATQRTARRLAEDPSGWSAQAARAVIRRYSDLAPAWGAERGTYRPIPLSDALARGGPWPPGLCVEVGSGTGLLTPLLTTVWPRTMSLDLTWEMLRRSPAAARVLADASHVPIGDGQAAAVVLADAPLFAPEVIRILTAGGVVIWSNALGAGAPHHVPVPVVLSVLRRASGGAPWAAVMAEAGWGLWAVLRRTSP